MAAHDPPDERQNIVKVQMVKRAHRPIAWRGELEDDESGSVAEHTTPLAQGRVKIAHISNTEGDDRASDASCRQRQVERISGDRKSTRLNSSHVSASRMPSS